jgi:hypothetical protein
MTPHQDFDDELRSIADQLRSGRPTATALELDELKQRVKARTASRSHNRRTTGFMRSRAVILTAMVFGFLLSTTGAGLAISGFSDNDQASVAQYPSNQPGGEVLPGTSEGDDSDNSVQPARQVQAGLQEESSQLPFTGFAAIPVLVMGLGLLGGGLVMRRSVRRN